MSIQGIVLAGGKSKRMGQDKALLKYKDDKTQLSHAFQAVGIHTENTFVSIAKDQLDERERNKFPLIVDHYEQIGPLGGILSAFEELPEAAILVAACDLPFISKENVAYLIEQRDPAKQATAYKGFKDGPEPLFCIYEPGALEELKKQLGKEHACPRKALYQMDIKLVDPLDPKDVENINRPEDLVKLNPDSEKEQTFQVQFYAALKEQAGTGEKTVSSKAGSPLSLYTELKKIYSLKTDIASIKVAVNDELKEASCLIKEGDSICFFPPFAGG